MQPGFFVFVLAGIAQVAVGGELGVLAAGADDRAEALAPGGVAGAPGDLAVSVGQLLRGAEVVGVDLVDDRGTGGAIRPQSLVDAAMGV